MMLKKLRNCIIALLAVVMTAAVFVACGGNDGDDNQTIVPPDEETTWTVSMVDGKTVKVEVEKGQPMPASAIPTYTPRKSGEIFLGWFADGQTTEFDWSAPITGDITIRAKYEPVDWMKVTAGVAYPQTDKSVVIGGGSTLYTVGTFEKGSFTVDVTPVEGSDCGVVFGATVPESGLLWEDTSYYTALINKDGVLLFATVAPWSEVVSGVELDNFDPTRTYKMKVAYNNGYCEISIDGKALIKTEIAEFSGKAVGCRSQLAGVKFGQMIFDANDLPSRNLTIVENYNVRNGEVTVEDGVITSKAANTLALVYDTENENNVVNSAKRLSYTMTTGGTGDNGIVFALSDNGSASYWEGIGQTYYFFFVDAAGNARLAKLLSSNEPWSEFGVGTNVKNSQNEYKLEVYIDGNTIGCYVNGTLVKSVEEENGALYTGTSYGIRAQAAGVTYTEDDVSDKYAVTINGETSVMKFVSAGTILEKPNDPQKDGFTFTGWYANGSTEEYDWDAEVNGDIKIEAKFELNADTEYYIGQGGVQVNTYTYTTTADNTLMMSTRTFERGSFTVTLKQNVVNDSGDNDFGVIFGVDTDSMPETNAWEGFDYLIVYINRNGTLFLANSNPWNILAFSATLETPPYNRASEYKIKVVYEDGYVRIYAGPSTSALSLAITADVGRLRGNGFGFRAQCAGTEFGKAIAIDENEKIDFDKVTDLGALTSRNGSEVEVIEGGYKTTSVDTLATSSVTIENGGSISAKIKTGVTGGDKCNGIIFAVPTDVSDKFWEGYRYYFFFINSDGRVLLTSMMPWTETFNAALPQGFDAAAEHTLRVNFVGRSIQCYVDDVLYFAAHDRDIALDGRISGYVGIRAQSAGVEYTDFEIVKY